MGTVGETEAGLDKPPKFGLKYKLNHEFELDTFQIFKPSLSQLAEIIPLTARYMKFYIGKKMANKRPYMDFIGAISAQRMYGCPIGGIGGGTIGRGFKGEFCRFQVYPGIYHYVTVPECQFIVNIRNAQKETIFQSVLSTYDKPKEAPESWQWNLNPKECEYTALYPKAWTTYDLSKYGIKLVCRQISPIIPNNYKDSSLPCAVFVFSAENVSNEHRDVSITFTWTEVLATSNKKKTAPKLDLERYSDEYTSGVTLEQKVEDTPCTFTISKKKQESETIHEGYCLWSAAKTSSYVWDCLKKNGRLLPDPSHTPPPPNGAADKKSKQKKIYKCDSVGLSSVISLAPGATGSTEFSLVWDMPVIKYKKDAKVNKRFYTKFFGSDGIAGPSIAAYALRNYKNWEKQIAEWQDPIFNNSNIPDWLKGALMNELYFVADGGSVWFDVRDDYPETDPRHEFGIFGYLEGHEYRMYNTYDVHFYASFALAILWPNLQVVVQYMFRDTITLEVDKFRTHLFTGKVARLKVKNSIPHDLGDPDNMPFTKINVYNIYDVSEWRDLNLKFILQVMRDYRLLRGHTAPFGSQRYQSMAFIDDVRAGTEDDLYSRATGQADFSPPDSPRSPLRENAPQRDCGMGEIVELLYSRNTAEKKSDVKENGDHQGPRESDQTWEAHQYLSDMYDSCVLLLRRAAEWDKDGDGIIENMGIPDQTFDAWVMEGPSAYCGGLWLASISVVRAMAAILGREEDELEFGKLLEKAQNSFEKKLWNGSYYLFDTNPKNSNVVMADQLAGQWFLRASGWTEQVFPTANVRKALSTIFAHNVEQYCRGGRGAVNGFLTGAQARVDTSAVQSEEMWTGVTYGLAALMVFEGMHEEAFVTAGGMYDALVRMGLAFETPEALHEDGRHRSVAYMRPLAIWGIYQALVARPPPPITQTNGQAHQTKDNTNL